jgi:hypothetical protein
MHLLETDGMCFEVCLMVDNKKHDWIKDIERMGIKAVLKNIKDYVGFGVSLWWL